MTTGMHPFLQHYQGYFRSLLKWEELDTLWQTLRERADYRWYVYAPGEAVPEATTDHDTLSHFVDELDQLLRHDHDYDYCGIVYVDNPAEPQLIKVYDPNNLGSSCGSGSLPPPLPGWVLSRIPPCELQVNQVQPGNRRRWWQRIFGA